jgi:hypothetical protein
VEWLLFIAVVSLGVPALAWLAQERLIFFPQPVASTAHLPARASPLESWPPRHIFAVGSSRHNRAGAGGDHFGGNAEEYRGRSPMRAGRGNGRL